MDNQTPLWLGITFMGLAAGLAAYAGRDYAVWTWGAMERDFSEKLRRLRMPTRRLRTYLIVWLVVIGLVFAGFWVAAGKPVLGLMLGVFLLAAPWYVLRRMAERHREKIEDQLADAMVMLANAVRAGLSLAQSLEILAAQCPKPINAEFYQIVAEYKLGKTLERTLLEAKERLRSENFALFAAALLASHESGGRLNETVERIAQSVLDLQRIERKVLSETAQARRSAVYMAIAPAFILAAYWFMDPESTRTLFTNLAGQLILGTAVVFNVIAYLWARVILNPDV